MEMQIQNFQIEFPGRSHGRKNVHNIQHKTSFFHCRLFIFCLDKNEQAGTGQKQEKTLQFEYEVMKNGLYSKHTKSNRIYGRAYNGKNQL